MPAYNEAENIETTAREWHKLLEKLIGEGGGELDNRSRLVIVDDGSKDESYLKLCSLRESLPYLQPLTKANEGHGATVLYAYRYALEQGASYIFQTDSDGQTLPDEFERFWKLRDQYDVLIGHRNARKDGFSRILVTKTLKLVLRIIFGLNVTDANTPFRLMKREVLSKYIVQVPEKFNLSNVMLSVLFIEGKERVKFIPITFRPRQGGMNSINMKKIIKIGFQAIKDFREIKKSMKRGE